MTVAVAGSTGSRTNSRTFGSAGGSGGLGEDRARGEGKDTYHNQE